MDASDGARSGKVETFLQMGWAVMSEATNTLENAMRDLA
jgi:hypothetical protein